MNRSAGLSLRSLDLEQSDPRVPLTVVSAGRRIVLRSACDITAEVILAAGDSPLLFVQAMIRSEDRSTIAKISWGQLTDMMAAWRAHHGLCDTPEQDRRLVMMLVRYGAAIEADLAAAGLDLVRLWRGRRWRLLLNLIDRLPRNTGYFEAMADDEDVARDLLDQENNADGSGKPTRRLSEYSCVVESIDNVYDRLGELIGVTIACRGAKPGRIPHAPRPITALERLRAAQRVDKHKSIVRRVRPDKQSD